MMPVRRQRAVLAIPQTKFRILSDCIVAKFRRFESVATWRDASNVDSREAFTALHRKS